MTVTHISAECPACNQHLAAFKGDGGKRRPEPGSLTICAHCQALLVFEDVGLRAATRIEWEALPLENQNFLKAQGARIVSRIHLR